MKTKILTNEQSFHHGFLLLSKSAYKGTNLKVLAQIMTGLENEFQKSPNGFSKHYGDDVQDQKESNESSWREMLEIARDTFNNGFEKIGVTHTEESFRNAGVDGRFAGKFYCRVKTVHKYRTFYYRNDTLLDAELDKYRNQMANGNSQELELKA